VIVCSAHGRVWLAQRMGNVMLLGRGTCTKMHENGRLTAKQEKAIAALLTEPSVAAAAAKAGIATSTLFGWLRDPTFDTAYRTARRAAVGHAIARLQQLSSVAVVVLATVMADKNTPASVRVAAASKLLDMALRAVEIEDLEARVAALEERYVETH
jgi:hypothetical protein